MQDAFSGLRVKMPRLTTAQRKKLKKMREQGIDTTKIRIEPRAAPSTSTRTPGQAVKRTVTDRKTPDEKVVKRAKEAGTSSHSYAKSVGFVNAVVVLATYPEGQMTKEDGARVNLLL